MRSDTDFRPPGSENEAFTFGQGSSWYGGFGRRHFDGWGGPFHGSTTVKSGNGALDDKGVFAVDHALAQLEPPPPGAPPPVVDPAKKKEEPLPRAATFTLQSSVTDQNRQAIGGSASFVVHPALVYVGVRSDKSVLNEGERAEVEAVVVDLEGERLEGRDVLVEVVRRETTRKAVEKGGVWTFEYETTEAPVESCKLTSASAPAQCAVTVGKPGTYLVRGSVKDDAGRTNRSESTMYVHGKDEVVWEQTDRRVDLVPDKRQYQPGDTATVLLRSPFTEARGVVVIEREGIARKMSVAVEGGAHTIEIPIAETMVGGVTLSTVLVRGRVEVPGAPPGQDLGMPAVAVGEVDLDVTTDAKKIFVELEPSAREIAPKDTLELTIRTKDAAGEARKAAVAVMVVDEGVLSLMDYKTPDPLAAFHYKRPGNVQLHALHARVLPRNPPDPTRAVLGGEQIGDAFGVGGLGLVGTGRGGGGTGEGTIGLGNIGTIGHGSGTGSGFGLGSGGRNRDFEADMPAAAAPMEERKQSSDAKPAAKRKALASARSAGVLGTTTPLLDPAQAMAQEVSLRTLFATTAYFDAEVLVDESGETTVSIPMPENLTTFRIMAVAIDTETPDRFGSADSSVRVRKPIMIRPSLPRFANFGDAFEASIMVDNQTGEAQAVLVGTRGLNVSLPSETQKVVEIPAGESREVRFDMAVENVGKMKLQFAAMSNDGRDATEITLPVHWPATTQAFADYGMTDSSVLQKIEPPKDALTGYGGLELSFGSTAMSGLEDAVEYLVTYPYECAEQTASRIVPIFALGKILDDFPIAETHDRALRDTLGKDGIARLLTHQLYDGGFGYWRNDESWPYLTNWVTFALLEGKKQGFTVEADALDRALRYVDNFVRHGYRTRWGDYYDWTSRAFGLWLLSGEGKASELFDLVWAHRDELPLYARAQMMAAAHRYGRTKERDEIRDQIKQAVVESARTIHFAESKSEAASDGLRVLMHSDVQTDAIVLMALLEVDPANAMLPKVMAGIMSERDPKKGGRWPTTHANAWALVAASRYYAAVEKDEPDFTARVWLDSQFAGEHAFAGRSMTKVNQRIPMAKLAGAGLRELVLGKEGPGKLYYRMGLRYAPADLKMKAEEQGFSVYREYEALPDEDGKVDAEAVKRLEDGGWQIKAGARVKVTINLVASDRANYVVVDDPLPAGLEGENPRFVTNVGAMASGTIDFGGRRPHGRRSYGYHHYASDGWWWPWFSFSHTEMRDDRIVLFADHMPAGVYTYSYTARATSIGTFQLPPVKAEAMYEPERFGHGSSSVVTVVE
jgi:uncharacterized protein YfaS (alpha-2-macroglobulin family)